MKRNLRYGVVLIASVVLLVVSVRALAGGNDETVSLACPHGQHAVVSTHGRNGGLTVENPPPGSVSGGDGTSVRASRDSQTATVHGGSGTQTECR